jgi:transposase InsO family protein
MLSLADPSFKIGRDYLFNLLHENGMLVKYRKRFIKTTDSDHGLQIYPNLLTDLTIHKPNQVWVVDITYIDTYEGFAYLFLVTDYFSRKILSFEVSHSLAVEGAYQALSNTISMTKPQTDLIHHSDHGSQYCSKTYQKLLSQNSIQVSMTGKNHCYDNAVAERINGILKYEFGLVKKLKSVKIAREAAASAIFIYNNERLHMSLDYITPASVYAA